MSLQSPPSWLSRSTLLAAAVLLPAAAATLAPQPARAAEPAPAAAPAAAAATPPAAPAGAVKSYTAPYPTFGSIERLDPGLDQILPAGAKLEKLAEGFDWTEGPVWVKKGGYLLFSDIPPNTIYRWQEGKGISVFMRPAGLSRRADRPD